MAKRTTSPTAELLARERAARACADVESLYDNAPVCLCVLDAELRYVRVNRCLIALVGKRATTFLGRTLAEIDPSIVPQTRRLFRQLVATGEPIHNIEYLADKKSRPGFERSWLAHWFPIKDARGRVVAVNIAFEESTERKRLEAERDRLLEQAAADLAALRESEDNFRRIAQNSPFGLGTYNTQGRITYMNPKLTEIVGYRLRDVPLLADWFQQAYPDPEYRAAVEAQWGADIQRVRRGQLRHSPVREYRLVCRDGSTKDLEITFALGKDITHAMFNDITERKRAEEALREATEFMQALLEFAPIPIYVRDATHRYRLVNREWERVFRQKREAVIGRPIDEVLPKELADYFEKVNRKVLATKRAVSTEETIDFPDGRHIFHTIKFPLRNAAGRVEAVGGISIDLTERIRAEEEILRLNDELEQRVADRTAELAAANRELRNEIAERRRLETEILEISEREQRRLGQDLHDELGQQLTGLGMMSAVLERQLREEQHPRARFAAELGEMLQRAVTTTRDLARGFYPVVLEEGGLLTALLDLAHRTEAVSGVRCVVRHRAAFRFPRPAAIHLYRIAQEAVSNAVRHAAPREIRVELGARRGVSRLRIVNDGTAYSPPPPEKRGFGLSIMRYRAGLIGAEVTVGAGARGGCEVVCVLGAAEH